jgi:hypothetical protein
MKLSRIADMSLPEIAARGRERLMKWMDRHGVASVEGGSADARDLSAQRARARLESCSSRFFPGAFDGRVPDLLAERFPAAVKDIFETAERVCEHRFDLLGERGLSFGSPIDWHLDPTTGRRAPREHWTRLDPLDVERIGDVKLIWELNRHQWLTTLAQAFYLSHDERYAHRALEAMTSWRHANPPGVGINWASSLEVALRIVSWTWTLVLLRRSTLLAGKTLTLALRGIALHAAHVERYLSRYTSPNTHLTGEALGLVYAGVLIHDTPAAARWIDTGAQILRDELVRQVLPDGVHFEQATGYQRYTAEIYLHFLALAAANAVPEGPETRARMARMLEFLLCIRSPDGSLPAIGDADGGTLLPLAKRGGYDARGVWGVAAVLFDREDFAWAAGGPTPEALWLWGVEALEGAAASPCPPETPPSRMFSEGGYAVLRSDWSDQAHQLVFDCGPLGAAPRGGHGHADLLSVQCAAFGESFIVDPGTYRYAAAPEWRAALRGTLSHSTVIVDAEPQVAPAGPFAWKSLPRAELREWRSTDALDYVDAEHAAYARLRDPVRHRRRIVFVKPRYWIIVDDLYGAATHHIELRLQLAGVRVELRPDGWAVAAGANTRGLFVRPFAAMPLDAEIRCGSSAPIEGWVAPDYGHRVPAPLLLYSAVTALPTRIVTLLLPVQDARTPPPDVVAVGPHAPGPVGLVFLDTRELVAVDPGGVRLIRGEVSIATT